MPATTTNLTIEQGTTFSHGWAVTYNGDPIDDTWTVAAQARAGYASAVLHEFAATVNEDGSVVIAVEPEESSAWSWRTAIYDVEVTSPDDVVLRVANGRISVSPEVTR